LPRRGGFPDRIGDLHEVYEPLWRTSGGSLGRGETRAATGKHLLGRFGRDHENRTFLLPRSKAVLLLLKQPAVELRRLPVGFVIPFAEAGTPIGLARGGRHPWAESSHGLRSASGLAARLLSSASSGELRSARWASFPRSPRPPWPIVLSGDVLAGRGGRARGRVIPSSVAAGANFFAGAAIVRALRGPGRAAAALAGKLGPTTSAIARPGSGLLVGHAPPGLPIATTRRSSRSTSKPHAGCSMGRSVALRGARWHPLNAGHRGGLQGLANAKPRGGPAHDS